MQLSNYILKGGEVFISGELKELDIAVKDGKIIEIDHNILGENIINVSGKIISFLAPSLSIVLCL